MYLPRSGSPTGRLLPLPARMPATCVPCPYVSVLVWASGLVTTEATTREVPSDDETRKSGRSPAMPVSMTATPMPLPVRPLFAHSLEDPTDALYDVANRLV